MIKRIKEIMKPIYEKLTSAYYNYNINDICEIFIHNVIVSCMCFCFKYEIAHQIYFHNFLLKS